MAHPHWLTGGFRPFFFLGSLAMAASVLMWLPVYFGMISLTSAFAPRDWHVHTLLFGGVAAIIAGFALTAVANWTGRPAISGQELFALVLVWLAGRVAVSVSALIGAPLAAAIDLMFLVALSGVFAREIILAGNHRNLKVVAVVGLLAMTNLGFHTEAYLTGSASYAMRASLSLVLLLILLIGGRILPAFTRNWLNARKIAPLPPEFGRGDAAVMVASGLSLACWTALPDQNATAAALVLAGLANLWRLSRWCGFATRREPLLLILHAGYLVLALGYLAVGTAILWPDLIDPLGAVHMWTAGAIGVMTLAVMTRASRGHSGSPLTADRLDLLVFALVLIGTLARIVAPYSAGLDRHFLDTAGLAWAGAYLAFAAGYARRLLLAPAAK
jgi:uncharacterized protein involved in response to NO